MNQDLLDSWKDIAAYLGRGVRTVQRWENNLYLPIRRPPGKPRNSIVAFKSELDRWLHDAHALSARPKAAIHDSALPLRKGDVRSLSQNLSRSERSSAVQSQITRKPRSLRLVRASLRYAKSAARHLGTVKQSRRLLADSNHLRVATAASLERARELLKIERRHATRSKIQMQNSAREVADRSRKRIQ